MSTGFTEPLLHSNESAQKAYSYRSGMGMVPSAEYNVFFDDFENLVVGNVPWGWEADIIDTSATIINEIEDTTGPGGVIRLEDATADEGAACYTKKFVQCAENKVVIEARVKLSDVTDHIFRIGLSDLTAVTNPEDLFDTSAANSISFGIADGAATLVLEYDKDNAGVTTDTSTDTDHIMVAATWHILALEIVGSATGSSKVINGYIDGKKVVSSSVETSVPDDILLSLFIASVNGNGAGANTADVDYIRVSQSRVA